ncbi:Putative feoB-like protein [Desulfamplus magnetovallimortis]|uniref:Magnetosome protein Mad17 n=2 Tax=Desulfamplus magnetovallimortis TaxID=1246637 RepID=M1RG59_9BACT|nr:ferrous iron transporter B [Desulfamplus magnetovallimortis]AGG16187.1 magnetosome protein Mad17' [Desulfamplus magnetovallimortis BW-1]SLM32074.1 Putative feoB-like protein [Desulfamplus magnetovallimortis]
MNNPGNIEIKRKIAVAGLPNTGKTLIFNGLTGDYNLVANCPFTTINIKNMPFSIDGDNDIEQYELIDTPGIFRFNTYSRSEMVTRDLLLFDSPDMIIQCIDAAQLKQSLSLTIDLLDLNIPLIICLNAIDETVRKGIVINSQRLSAILKVPVVESVATTGQGLDELKNAIRATFINYNKSLTTAPRNHYESSRTSAAPVSHHDLSRISTTLGNHNDLSRISTTLGNHNDSSRVSTTHRSHHDLSRTSAETMTHHNSSNVSSLSHIHTDYEDGISAIYSLFPENLSHKRVWAFLLMMNDPFVLSGLERLYPKEEIEPVISKAESIRKHFKGNIGLEINKKRNRWIDDVVEKVVRRQKLELEDFSQKVAGICRHPFWGVPVLFAIVYVMFLLVVHVANNIAAWMESHLWVPVEELVVSFLPTGFWHDFLIGDYGVLSLGVANAVITVLPILSVFFIMFNTLEDIGYIPNLTVLTRRLFQKVGLSGASVMPLVLGFGCKTMATMTTKSLQSPREKFIAIYLIAFAIPCAAQMGLNMSILGRMGTTAFLIVFSVLFVVEVTAGLLLNLLLEKEDQCLFIQELPRIRMPEPKAVLVKTWYKLYWFLKESLPVFIYAALALFTLDRVGVLDASKIFLSPVIEGFLGLPLEMVDALILCMARHEAAAGLIMNLIAARKLDFVQCIVAVTITTMFIPCFANIMAMIHELKFKSALGMAIIINVSSFLIAGLLNWVLLKIFV